VILVIRSTLDNEVEGTIEMSPNDAVVRATGAGVWALTIGVMDPETGDRLTVGDGICWLRALPFEVSHSGYHYCEVEEDGAQARADLGMPPGASLVHIGPVPVTDLLNKAAGRETPGATTWRPAPNVGTGWDGYTVEMWGTWLAAEGAGSCPGPVWIVPGHGDLDVMLAWRTLVRVAGSEAYVEARWDPDRGHTWSLQPDWLPAGMTQREIKRAARGQMLIEGLHPERASAAAAKARADRSESRRQEAKRLHDEGRRVPGIARKVKLSPRHTRRLLKKSDTT